MKRFLLYFSWTIVVGVVLYFGIRIQAELKEQFKTTFEIMPALIFSTVYPIIVGMLMGTMKLIQDIRAAKSWSIDWMKIVAIGLPSLYVTFIPLLYFTIPYSKYLLFATEIINLGGGSLLSTISGIVFGYVFIDSLKE
ncbi:hypothetical protein LC040_02110 [Bacillus tianshenii]|nr:hypothetical protein LC040_02110 [Bacillus tianshenii]